MPVMHPAELWQRSGRWDAHGREMFRLKDRKGADARARHDARRGRVDAGRRAELLPRAAADVVPVPDQAARRAAAEGGPDAHPRVHHEGLLQLRPGRRGAGQVVRRAPRRLRARVRADRHPRDPGRGVERLDGRLGLDRVHLPVGDRRGRHHRTARVAATRRTARRRCRRCRAVDPAADAAAALAAPERFDTPGVRTIEDLATGYDAPADRQIKTLVYVLDGKLTLVLVRGDHALEEQKLIDATGAVAVRPAEAEEIFDALGAHPGSLGAVGVPDLPVIADLALRGRAGMTTGANTDDVHLRGVDVARDIDVGQWADLRAARARGAVHPLRSAARGHQGHRGRAHLQARLQVLRRVRPVRAAGPTASRSGRSWARYGIGVERAMAAMHRGAPRRQGHRLAGGGRAVRGRRGRRAAERRRRRRGGRAGLPVRCSTPAST